MAGKLRRAAFLSMEIEEIWSKKSRVFTATTTSRISRQASPIMGTHREADLSLKRVKTLLNEKAIRK
ncbi:hypothetical protein ACVXHB_17290 [Escherichia coli]